MSGHTPGPWKVWHGDIVAEGDAMSDYDDYVVAGIGKSTGGRSSVYCPIRAHKPEGQANARLIAAAPELLEALERVLSDDEVALSRPDYVFAQEAITKAKGEDA